MNIALRKIGNSEGIIIPKEVLDNLGLKAGDILALESNAEGIVLRIENKDLTEQLAAARLGMKKYKVALAELAK